MKTTLKNLRIAIDKLQELANITNPEIRTDFNMLKYGCYQGLSREYLHNCKTVGCALGNIAGKVFPIVDSDFDSYGKFNYTYFSIRIFPELNGDTWSFLFSSSWYGYQPSFDDFIKRAEHFLKMKGKIGDWEYSYSEEIETNLR